MRVPFAAQVPSAPRGQQLYCFGFGPWKYGFVRAYLRSVGLPPRFVPGPLSLRLRGARPGDVLVVWGLRDDDVMRRTAAKLGLAIWRMEDGFLRSVGLGSDFEVPSSLVLDRQGIYFDPRAPSDLETILSTTDFAEAELKRAEALRASIVASALSKYNFSSRRPPLTRPAHATRVLLVPGQVEDDASIQAGCVDLRTNLELLEAVRAANPDAYVIYKPHPDVLSGNRAEGALSLARAEVLADAVITDAPLPECLAIADEVHTLTSLVGFEALLRGLRVFCYGRPFYSGWGLTTDRHRVERRTRTLTLPMLVAGVLLRYPLYLSQSTWELTTPEAVIAELRQALAARASSPPPSQLTRQLRKLQHAARGVFRVRS